MDRRQAQESLDEVNVREHQVMAETWKSPPWWYFTSVAAIFLTISVSYDLEDRMGSGWPVQVTRYAIPLVMLCWLGIALHRSMRVRIRRYPGRMKTYMLYALYAAGACLFVDIGVGMVLRIYKVPWDNTISGAVATLAFVGGYVAAVRRVASDEPAPASQRAE